VASTTKTVIKNPDQNIKGIPSKLGVILFSLKIIKKEANAREITRDTRNLQIFCFIILRIDYLGMGVILRVFFC
jgi:hypothetical protein